MESFLLRVVGKKTGYLYPDDEMEPDYFIEKEGLMVLSQSQ